MSSIEINTKTFEACLYCDKCGARWKSPVTKYDRWRDEELAAAPAFDQGWRIFVAGRGRRTYCPDCGPTVPMRQVLP